MSECDTTSDLERLRQCYALRLPVSNSFINIREVYDVVTQKVPSQRIAAFFLDEGGDCYQIFLADVEAYCFLLKEGIVLFGDHLKPHPSIVCFNVYCRFPSVTNKNLIDLFNTYGPVLQVCHIKDSSIPFDHAFSAKRRLMFYLNGQQTEIDLPQIIKAQFNEYNVMLKIIKFCMACMKENHDAANCDEIFKKSYTEMHVVNSSKIEEDILEQVVSTMNNEEYEDDSPNSDDMEAIVNQLDSDDGNEIETSVKDMSDDMNDDFMQEIVDQLESDDNESETSTKNASDEVNEDFVQETEELISEADGSKQVSSSNKKNKKSPKNNDSEKNYTLNLRQRHSPENTYIESKLRKRLTRPVLLDGQSSESDSETNVPENKTEKKRAYARKRLNTKISIKEEDGNSERASTQSKNNQSIKEPLDKGCEVSSNNIPNERTLVTPEQNSDCSSRTTPNKHDIPVRKRKRLPSLSDLDDKFDPAIKSSQSTAKTNLSDILSFKDLKMPADMKPNSNLDVETFRKFLIGTEGIDDLTIHMFQYRAFKEQIKAQMEALFDALDKENAIDCAFRTKVVNLKKMLW